MLAFWSAKGGSGTSVVAAAVAVVLGRRRPIDLVDLAGDQAALLGVEVRPDAPARRSAPSEGGDLSQQVRTAVSGADQLSLIDLRNVGLALDDAAIGEYLVNGCRAGSVFDVGTSGSDVARVVLQRATPILVTRACYLSLRRAVASDRLAETKGVVLVQEPGRALTARDVSDVLGRPVVATVRTDESVSRAVDAGVLGLRLPDSLRRPAQRLLGAFGGVPQAGPDSRSEVA